MANSHKWSAKFIRYIFLTFFLETIYHNRLMLVLTVSNVISKEMVKRVADVKSNLLMHRPSILKQNLIKTSSSKTQINLIVNREEKELRCHDI